MYIYIYDDDDYSRMISETLWLKSSSFIKTVAPTGDCAQEKALQLQSLEEAVLKKAGDLGRLMNESHIPGLVIYG